MNGRIIVGIDGSGPSRAAFSWAATRAHATKAAILAVHCVEDGGNDAAGVALLDETVANAEHVMPTVALDTRLLHGAAAWELAGVATAHDLLVVGTHKTGYLSGRVLGTRGIVVASAAPCSVAIVPDAAPGGRTGIIVGVGGSGASHDAVLVGAREAARLREGLTLLHANDGTEDGHAVIADAVALAASISPELDVRSRLSRRRPAEALLDASRSASLLVIGATRLSANRVRHLGSVSYEVLLNINTTVMVARQ